MGRAVWPDSHLVPLNSWGRTVKAVILGGSSNVRDWLIAFVFFNQKIQVNLFECVLCFVSLPSSLLCVVLSSFAFLENCSFIIVCLWAAYIVHLEMQGNWHSCNPKDLRNRKVELQRKMKLSLGAMIYTGCFLNHFQPTNDREIRCFFPHNVLFRWSVFAVCAACTNNTRN